MTEGLISALLERQAFANDTIITAKYQSMDLFGRVFNKIGDFRIHNIINSKNKTVFELITLNDGSMMIKATSDAIKAVDGMEIDRYADIYDLHPDGTKKKVGRKRGRKPKTQLSA